MERWDWAQVRAAGLMADLWGFGPLGRVQDQLRGIKKFWHMQRRHRLLSAALREAYEAGFAEGNKKR